MRHQHEPGEVSACALAYTDHLCTSPRVIHARHAWVGVVPMHARATIRPWTISPYTRLRPTESAIEPAPHAAHSAATCPRGVRRVYRGRWGVPGTGARVGKHGGAKKAQICFDSNFKMMYRINGWTWVGSCKVLMSSKCVHWIQNTTIMLTHCFIVMLFRQMLPLMQCVFKRCIE